MFVRIFFDRCLNYILTLLLTNGGNPGMKGGQSLTNGASQNSSPFGCEIIYTSDYLSS